MISKAVAVILTRSPPRPSPRAATQLSKADAAHVPGTVSLLTFAESSASTNTSITRTGLLWSMKSSRHSGKSVIAHDPPLNEASYQFPRIAALGGAADGLAHLPPEGVNPTAGTCWPCPCGEEEAAQLANRPGPHHLLWLLVTMRRGRLLAEETFEEFQKRIAKHAEETFASGWTRHHQRHASRPLIARAAVCVARFAPPGEDCSLCRQ